MNILICFLSGLGNMLLFMPTLQAIRHKYPNAKITLWFKQHVAFEVASHFDLIDNFNTYHPNSIATLYSQFMEILSLRKEVFDLVITTSIEKGFKVRLAARMIKGKRRIGYSTGKFSDRWFTDLLDFTVDEHETERHFKIAHLLDSNATKQFPRWKLKEKEVNFAKALCAEKNILDSDIVVGIHPGCSEGLRYKRWPQKRFAELADTISTKHKAKILLFGGKEESGLCKQIIGLMKTKNVVPLAGRITLPETAALINNCNYFVSNDSGLMHIAAATRTPQIALFGSTSISKNTPLSDIAIVINGNKNGSDNKNTIEDITVNEAMVEFEKLIQKF